MSTLGERLRAERERLGLSQQALAEVCGVTMRSQRNYETNERAPDASYLVAFAHAGGNVLRVLIGTDVPTTPATDWRVAAKMVGDELCAAKRVVDGATLLELIDAAGRYIQQGRELARREAAGRSGGRRAAV